MKNITKKQYDRLIHLKEMSDHLATMQDEYYKQSTEILECEYSNGWIIDYFYNSNGSLNDLLSILDVVIDKDMFVGDSDHEHDDRIL